MSKDFYFILILIFFNMYEYKEKYVVNFISNNMSYSIRSMYNTKIKYFSDCPFSFQSACILFYSNSNLTLFVVVVVVVVVVFN